MNFRSNISTENEQLSNIIMKAKQHDMQALKLLYNQYSHQMVNTSLRITKNLHDTEDIVQEAFIVSFQKLEDLKTPHTYGAWLKKIVVNLSLKSIKSKWSIQDIKESDLEEEENNQAWYKNISYSKINEAILRLPNGCREVLCLYLLEEYKHKEVAELLGVTVSNSKSQYRYALKLLKEDLSHLIDNN